VTAISEIIAVFTSGCSEWRTNCLSEHSMRKRSQPEKSVKTDTVVSQRIQEAQLMLINSRYAFRGQSRSPNSRIPYVSYSFLLCNSNFVFKRRRFYDIRLQKMLWPWNRGQRSLKVIESGTIRKIVYGFLLVFCNIVPKRTVLTYSTSKLPRPWKPG